MNKSIFIIVLLIVCFVSFFGGLLFGKNVLSNQAEKKLMLDENKLTMEVKKEIYNKLKSSSFLPHQLFDKNTQNQKAIILEKDSSTLKLEIQPQNINDLIFNNLLKTVTIDETIELTNTNEKKITLNDLKINDTILLIKSDNLLIPSSSIVKIAKIVPPENTQKEETSPGSKNSWDGNKNVDFDLLNVLN